MRVLGIDYGEKKMGLAFGDTETKIASPLHVMENTGDDVFQKIAELVRDEVFDKVVVGIPMRAGQFHNAHQEEKTKRFVERLTTELDIPVETEDERYTTAASQVLQKEEGSGAEEDALAAMLMLKGYLERSHGV